MPVFFRKISYVFVAKCHFQQGNLNCDWHHKTSNLSSISNSKPSQWKQQSVLAVTATHRGKTEERLQTLVADFTARKRGFGQTLKLQPHFSEAQENKVTFLPEFVLATKTKCPSQLSTGNHFTQRFLEKNFVMVKMSAQR